MLELVGFVAVLVLLAIPLAALSPVLLVAGIALYPRKYSVGFDFSKGVKRRVLVVGGGAAGTAAAWSLARFPQRFDVEVSMAWCEWNVPNSLPPSVCVLVRASEA